MIHTQITGGPPSPEPQYRVANECSKINMNNNCEISETDRLVFR